MMLANGRWDLTHAFKGLKINLPPQKNSAGSVAWRDLIPALKGLMQLSGLCDQFYDIKSIITVLISCRALNSLPLGYENQSVDIVEGSNLCSEVITKHECILWQIFFSPVPPSRLWPKCN
jgi:hypothetical protein